MANFVQFAKEQGTRLPVVQPPATITASTYIVTGANSGLGFECTKRLVRMGALRVILAVRDREKGNEALEAIHEATGRKDVGEVWELDLESLESIERFGVQVEELHRLDALIANAGVAMTKWKANDGLEVSVKVNTLGTFFMALRTLPKLRESSQKFGIHTNITFVTSAQAMRPNMKGAVERLEGNILETVSREENFDLTKTYAMSKLLQIYAVRQLASIFPVSKTGVVINMTSPGLCTTELDRNGSRIQRMVMGAMRMMLARSAEQGSSMLLQAAFARAEAHGTYCAECEIKDYRVPTWISDAAGAHMQKRVWEELVKQLNMAGHSVDVECE